MRKICMKTNTNTLGYQKKKKTKNEKKLQHLQRVQHSFIKNPPDGQEKDLDDTRKVPDRLKEYSRLSIFGGPKKLPKPEMPVGPYLCDPNIKLSKEELMILSKDPKFSLMTECSREEFCLENEKSLAKHHYGQQENSRKKKTDYIKNIVTSQDQGEQVINESECVKEKDILKEIWDGEKHRFVCDPFHKTLDFRFRKPTDYKLNKRLMLPRPLDDVGEFYCELKRRSYNHVFDEFQKQNDTEKSKTLQAGPSVKENKKDSRHVSGVRSFINRNSDDEVLVDTVNENEKINKQVPRDSKTTVKKQKVYQNLTYKEKKGLKSITKRINKGEMMITPTDKSGRFAVLSTDQYLESGRQHTSKDEKLCWKDVKYLKNQVNSHMHWFRNIFGYCDKSNPDRMRNNLVVSDLDLPEMAILVKDHKSWKYSDQKEGKKVPSRPVVSGNSTINTHLSELLSEIVEPVALELKGREIQSSEEALSLLDALNASMKSGSELFTTAHARQVPPDFHKGDITYKLQT